MTESTGTISALFLQNESCRVQTFAGPPHGSRQSRPSRGARLSPHAVLRSTCAIGRLRKTLPQSGSLPHGGTALPVAIRLQRGSGSQNPDLVAFDGVAERRTTLLALLPFIWRVG